MKYCPECHKPYSIEAKICPADNNPLIFDPNGFVGKIIDGKYNIIVPIGSGGMGAVYRADQSNLKRPVAIKILRLNTDYNEKMIESFRREAEILARLSEDSDNFPKVHDYNLTNEGIAYISMELLNGKTLKRRLGELGNHGLEFSHIKDTLQQITEAVDLAHSRGVVHCDLKPSNIMLVKRLDGNERVKVLDFGIARIISDSTQSLTTGAMFTPSYASPEQLRGLRPDKLSDIYSLGVVLYEMLTGECPFPVSEDSPDELLSKKENKEYKALHLLRPDTPKAVEELVGKTLEADPNQRPPTAGEVASEFLLALNSELGLKTRRLYNPVPETNPTQPPPITSDAAKESARDPISEYKTSKVNPPKKLLGQSPKLIAFIAAALILAAVSYLLWRRSHSTLELQSPTVAANPTPSQRDSSNTEPIGSKTTGGSIATSVTPATTPTVLSHSASPGGTRLAASNPENADVVSKPESTKSATLDEAKLLIASFSRGEKSSVLGYGNFGGNVIDHEKLAYDQGRRDVMRVFYREPNAMQRSSFILRFKISNFQPNDWSAITLWMRSGTSQLVHIELKINERKWGVRSSYKHINNKWQPLRIPLKDFDRSRDWNGTDELSITFEGTIYLDEVNFVR